MAFSRYTAFFLLFCYVAYLAFQLKTHTHLFAEDEEEEEKELTIAEGLVWLAVVTVLISMLSDFLVDAIKGTAHEWGIPEIFLGVIFIPIVGNAAEHWTALSAAYKSKMGMFLLLLLLLECGAMRSAFGCSRRSHHVTSVCCAAAALLLLVELALGVAIGSSTQITIFVIPFMVILGWMMGQPLSLFFEPFETVTLLASAILTQFVMSEGRSTWLSGIMLVFAYFIVAGMYCYVLCYAVTENVRTSNH